jgi:hypothetical protein
MLAALAAAADEITLFATKRRGGHNELDDKFRPGRDCGGDFPQSVQDDIAGQVLCYARQEEKNAFALQLTPPAAKPPVNVSCSKSIGMWRNVLGILIPNSFTRACFHD